MDHLRKNFSSSKPYAVTKTNLSDFQKGNSYTKDKISEETNENEQQFHRGMEMKVKNSMTQPKNFMSTTISAASKKKILVEKNETPLWDCSGSQFFKETPQTKNQDLGFDHPDVASQITPFSSRIHGSGKESEFSSGSQPYDPLTNYLSPRPEFLRYNPNRRREIYLLRERELRGTEEGSGSDLSLSFDHENSIREGTPSDSSASPLPKQEDGLSLKPLQYKENHESEEDSNTVEEEGRPSCCSLVWKSLLLLGVLFFSTYYISSMNSFSTRSSPQDFEGFKGNCLKIEDALQQTTENVDTSMEKYSGTFARSSNTCLNVHFKELTIGEEGISSNGSDGLPKTVGLEGEELQDEGEMIMGEGSDLLVDSVNLNAILVVAEGECEESVGSDKELQDEGEMIMAEDSDLLVANGNLNANSVMVEGESEEPISSGEESQDEGEMITTEDSDLLVDNGNLNANSVMVVGESEEPISSGEESQDEGEMITPEDSDLLVDNGNWNANTVMAEGESEESVSTSEMLALENEKNRNIETVIDEEQGEVAMMEVETAETGGVTEQAQFVLEYEEKKNKSAVMFQFISYPSSYYYTIEEANALGYFRMEIAAAVFLVLVVVATAIMGFLHCRRRKASVENSSPSSESAVVERSSSELSKMEDVEVKRVDSFVSFAQTSDNYKEFYEICPPTVELLGEFSVADVGISRMMDSTTRKKTASVETHYSQSQGKKSERKSLSSSTEEGYTFSEFSTAESTPHGSSTSQEKLSRRRGDGDGHVEVKAVSTPVRRSSRIRSRVTSP